jgi:glucokinase
MLAIGVDIGGTKIAFGLVNEQGETLATHRIPTQMADGSDSLLDNIAQGIEYVVGMTQQPIAGIGIGSPGHVDPVAGWVRNAVNLRWQDVALRDEIQRRLKGNIPIYIEKDANAAALGEMYFGAALGCKDFMLIAIGTGLGGGAVVNGQLVNGANAYAMEVGHIGLNLTTRLCKCGLRGCPEMSVSGTGLLAGFRERRVDYPDSPLAAMIEATTEDILHGAQNGDLLATRIIDDAVEGLGTVMACCAALFNPGLFVIGGGLGHAAFDLLYEKTLRQIRERTLLASHEQVQIVRSEVTSSAIGAASLVWHAQR